MRIKKLVSLIAVVMLFFSMSTTVLGGDVPESLLYEEYAQVFWGTVKNISSEGDDIKVEVSCDKISKGEVNEAETYTNPYTRL